MLDTLYTFIQQDPIGASAWVLVALSLAGNIFVNRKQVIGQWLWAVANVGWIAFNIYKGIIPQAFLFAVYLCICVWGINKWTKEAEQEKKTAE